MELLIVFSAGVGFLAGMLVATIPYALLRRRKGKRKLTALTKDYKLTQLIRLAEKVFNNPDKAMRWLNKPHAHWMGMSPLEFAATEEEGARLVEEALIRLEEGLSA